MLSAASAASAASVSPRLHGRFIIAVPTVHLGLDVGGANVVYSASRV